MDERLERLRLELIANAKKKTRERFSGQDIAIVRAVTSIDVLDETFNLLYETVREWYSLYFPELEESVDPDKYLEFIATLLERKNFTEDRIKEVLNNSEKAKEIAAWAKDTSGGNFDSGSLEALKKFAGSCLEIKKQRTGLTSFLEGKMKESFPALSDVAGEIIGAKLIAKAGSIERLAFFPSSTIQLIFAEKALFRHLKRSEERRVGKE